MKWMINFYLQSKSFEESAYYAAFDTLQLLFMNLNLHQTSKTFFQVSNLANNHGWINAAKFFNWIGKNVKYTIYAYNVIDQGFISATTAIASGLGVEKAVETIGKKLLTVFFNPSSIRTEPIASEIKSSDYFLSSKK